MSRYSEFQDALPTVYHNGQPSVLQRDAIARLMSNTRVPPEHVSTLSAIHTGAQMRAGAGALYDHSTRSMLLRGNPERLALAGDNMRNRQARLIAHETNHHYQHTVNPAQFSQYLGTPQGRGYLEASAENYADQAVPESFSGYDYEVGKGSAAFDMRTYKAGRGKRYGNIDPRLR